MRKTSVLSIKNAAVRGGGGAPGAPLPLDPLVFLNVSRFVILQMCVSILKHRT